MEGSVLRIHSTRSFIVNVTATSLTIQYPLIQTADMEGRAHPSTVVSDVSQQPYFCIPSPNVRVLTHKETKTMKIW